MNKPTDLETRGHPSYFVHPSAIVDEPAHIGENTRIYHFCHICSGARVGKRCVLGQNVFVASTAILGHDVRVQNNVSIYDGVIIEDSVFLGPSVVFTNVTNPRAEIDRRTLIEVTRVRHGATIGANATILCGLVIGAYAFVGAGAAVAADVQPHALVVGVPARWIGWACRCGERLPGFDGTGASTCVRCGDRYRSVGAGIERG